MKAKTVWLTLLFFLTVGVFPLYVEGAQKIKRLGVTPIYKTKVRIHADKVYSVAKKVEKDLKVGFQKAGIREVFDPFMDQLKAYPPAEVKIQPGEALEWMIFKKGKLVGVAKDVVWAGKKPFRAFRTVVQYQDKNYEFIIPEICLNVSLKSITDIPKPPPPPPPPPKVEAPAPPPPPPPAAEEAKVEPPPPPPPAEPAKVEEPKKGFIVVDAAPMMRTDPTEFGLLRIGYMYKFTDQMALTGLVGSALLLREHNNGIRNDYPAYTADVIFSYYPLKRFFIGVGAGVWVTNPETKVDGIFETGYHLTDFAKDPNIAVFLEGRSSFNKTSQGLPSERIGLGIRLFF